MINSRNYFGAALLAAAFAAGCDNRDNGRAESLSSRNEETVAAKHPAEVAPAQEALSSRDAELLALLRQSCSSMDLTQLPIVSSPAESKICSPDELRLRIALCEAFNELQSQIKPVSRSAALKNLELYLTHQGGRAGASHIISELGAIAQEFEAPVEIHASTSHTDDHWQKLHLTQAALADRLAADFGVVLTEYGVLLPVVATITQPGSGITFEAHVVYSTPLGRPAPIGSTNSGGFITLDFLRCAEQDLNITLANEFAHQFLRREGIIPAGGSPFNRMKNLRAADPFPELVSTERRSALETVIPDSLLSIEELFSDAWSTQVDVADVDRIIENLFGRVVFSSVKRSLGDDLSPALREVLDRDLVVNHHYELPEQIVLGVILDCYDRDGKSAERKAKLEELRAGSKNAVELFARLNKMQLALDAEGEKDPGSKMAKKPDEDSRLLADLKAEINLTTVRAKKFSSAIPAEYKLIVPRALQHYADQFVGQLREDQR